MTWDPHYKYNNSLGSPVNYLMYVIVSANPFLSRICNLFQIAKHILPFKQFVQLKWLTCKIISAPPMVIFSLFSHPFELFIIKPFPHCSAYCFTFSDTVPLLLKLFSLCIPCHRKYPEQTVAKHMFPMRALRWKEKAVCTYLCPTATHVISKLNTYLVKNSQP